jgi:hypothetical protein
MAEMIAPQPAREIKALTQTFELEEATVVVPAPDGAEFGDLDGLPEGERHLTWTAAPGAFFMVSAGPGAAYAPASVPAEVDSDEPAPLAAPGARRIAYRAIRRRPRRLVAAPEGQRGVPEETVEELSDLLFVPGEREHLRIGYRVAEDAPEELRGQLARMLDGVEVRRRDA